MEALHKIREVLMKILGLFIIFLFAMMTIIGTYQIVTRYFFNRPSTVSEELLTYSFTWMALLASAYVFGKRDHMRMGFLADKITGTPRTVLETAIDFLTFAFAAVVIRRNLHHEADHDPDDGLPSGSHGIHLHDRSGDRNSDYVF